MENRFTDYLLGKVPESEADAIEEQLFIDDTVYVDVSAAADDLVLAYIRGLLSRDDRALFERHFLASPRHRERLEFVQDFLKAAEISKPGRVALVWQHPVAFRVLAASLVVAAVGAALWRGESPPDQFALGPTSTISDAFSAAKPSPLPVQTPDDAFHASVAVVSLPSLNTAAPVGVALTADTDSVNLQVPVGTTAHPSFDVVLRDAQGDAVWRAEGVVQSGPGQPLTVSMPADVLGSGRYALTVEGERMRGSSDRLSLTYTLNVTGLPAKP